MVSSTSNKNLEAIKDSLMMSGLVNGLTDEELAEVATIAVEQHFKKGTIILLEDSTSRDLFIIHKGRVSVRLALPFTRFQEEIIARISEQEIFGEFSLANGSPRSASVRAEVDVIAYQYGYDRLINLMEENTRIGYILMRNLAAIIANRIRESQKTQRKFILSL